MKKASMSMSRKLVAVQYRAVGVVHFPPPTVPFQPICFFLQHSVRIYTCLWRGLSLVHLPLWRVDWFGAPALQRTHCLANLRPCCDLSSLLLLHLPACRLPWIFLAHALPMCAFPLITHGYAQL
jgi:hypothetical protein